MIRKFGVHYIKIEMINSHKLKTSANWNFVHKWEIFKSKVMQKILKIEKIF